MENETKENDAYELIKRIYEEQYKFGNPLFALLHVDKDGIAYGKEFIEQYNRDIIKFASDLEKSLQ